MNDNHNDADSNNIKKSSSSYVSVLKSLKVKRNGIYMTSPDFDGKQYVILSTRDILMKEYPQCEFCKFYGIDVATPCRDEFLKMKSCQLQNDNDEKKCLTLFHDLLNCSSVHKDYYQIRSHYLSQSTSAIMKQWLRIQKASFIKNHPMKNQKDPLKSES